MDVPPFFILPSSGKEQMAESEKAPQFQEWEAMKEVA
jgi:hypothetical protein